MKNIIKFILSYFKPTYPIKEFYVDVIRGLKSDYYYPKADDFFLRKDGSIVKLEKYFNNANSFLTEKEAEDLIELYKNNIQNDNE